MLLRAIGVWWLLLVIAIVNGAIRETVLTPRLGRKTGHTISTLSLSALILVAAWLTAPLVRYVAPVRRARSPNACAAVEVGQSAGFRHVVGSCR